MADDLFEQVASATAGDELRLTLDADSTSAGGTATVASPVDVRVTDVREETLDARQKDLDVEGIIDRRLLFLDPADSDDGDTYVIESRSPVVGEDTVLPLRAGGPDDDRVVDAGAEADAESTVAVLRAVEIVS
ncbi:hypothetical protein DVK02_02300 [Halobellus sp. Atlit-31R]|nr:hypothetical protein DVK02_02300 [Halobellus sp. Atlit-31R]